MSMMSRIELPDEFLVIGNRLRRSEKDNHVIRGSLADKQSPIVGAKLAINRSPS